jgi:hypothetical protein
MYYGLLARDGYLGIVLYALLIVLVGRRLILQLRGTIKQDDFSPMLGLCLLVSALLLGYTYEIRNDQILLLVLPLLMARRKMVRVPLLSGKQDRAFGAGAGTLRPSVPIQGFRR